MDNVQTLNMGKKKSIKKLNPETFLKACESFKKNNKCGELNRKITHIKISTDLVDCSYKIARDKYFEKYKEWPVGIVISSNRLFIEVEFDMEEFDLRVTILSGLPDDFCMVYGKKGIVYYLAGS